MDLVDSLVFGVVLSAPLVSSIATALCGFLSYQAWLAALERLASRRTPRGPRALATASLTLALGVLLFHVFLSVALADVLSTGAVLALFLLRLLLAALNLAHAWFRWSLIGRATHHPRIGALAQVPHAAGRSAELQRVARSIGLPRFRDVLRRH